MDGHRTHAQRRFFASVSVTPSLDFLTEFHCPMGMVVTIVAVQGTNESKPCVFLDEAVDRRLP